MIDRHKCRRCQKPSAPDRTECEYHLAKGRERRARYALTSGGIKNINRHKAEYATFQRGYRRGAGRFYYVKASAGRKGLAWTLSREDWEALICQSCEYCGFPNDVETSIGLDRLDNSLGYEPGNVVSCCSSCNIARNDAFTPTEMKIIGATIRQVKLARLEACLD